MKGGRQDAKQAEVGNGVGQAHAGRLEKRPAGKQGGRPACRCVGNSGQLTCGDGRWAATRFVPPPLALPLHLPPPPPVWLQITLLVREVFLCYGSHTNLALLELYVSCATPPSPHFPCPPLPPPPVWLQLPYWC